MSPLRSVPLVMLTFGVVLAAIATGWFMIGRKAAEPSGAAVQPIESVSESTAVHLYFGDRKGLHLVAEQRVMDRTPDDVRTARQLLEALIEGPREGKSRTLPPDATVESLFLTPDGTAYVDFGRESFAGHPGGVNAELLSIYSIVDTLVLNIDAVRSVKILIGGQEAETLAGHVTLRHPFTADMLWIR